MATKFRSDAGLPVLEAGDEVTVYVDPLSEHRAEGQAILVELASRRRSGVEHWWVRFAGDAGRYYRAIRVDADGRNIQQKGAVE